MRAGIESSMAPPQMGQEMMEETGSVAESVNGSVTSASPWEVTDADEVVTEIQQPHEGEV